MSEPEPESTPDTKRIGLTMLLLAWIMALLLLAWFFGRQLDRQRNPNPISVTSNHAIDKEVVLQRNRYGHYVATATINGRPMEVMIDTGATDVAIPEAAADQLGLARGAPQTYITANGPARGYNTIVDEIALGNIVIRNVRASINPGMKDTQVLLGMSYLKTLELVQRGDQLTIRQGN